jgi:hypothetical protein
MVRLVREAGGTARRARRRQEAEGKAMPHVICITPRSTLDNAVENTNPICWYLYDDKVVDPNRRPGPPPPEDWGGFNPIPWGWGPQPEPWGQIQALAVILQGVSAMPERAPMRQELHDIARRALEEAVEALGDGVQLVEKELGRVS